MTKVWASDEYFSPTRFPQFPEILFFFDLKLYFLHGELCDRIEIQIQSPGNR